MEIAVLRSILSVVPVKEGLGEKTMPLNRLLGVLLVAAACQLAISTPAAAGSEPRAKAPPGKGNVLVFKYYGYFFCFSATFPFSFLCV